MFYSPMKSVGVIGGFGNLFKISGGLSGLICSQLLSEAGYTVTIFEKNSSLGGRISTFKPKNESFHFDIGAQYFTSRNENFINYLKEMKETKIIQEWKSNNFSFEKENKFVKKTEQIQRFVGVTSQSSFIENIISKLSVNVEILQKEVNLVKQENEFHLFSNNENIGKFDKIIFSTPPDIIKKISKNTFDKFEEKFSKVEISTCECLMVSFKKSLNIEIDSCFINNSDKISWISKENSKPNRDFDVECWVIHSTKNFKSKDPMMELYEEFIKILKCFDEKINIQSPSFQKLHSWDYAAVPIPLTDGYFYDDNVGVCGDWCNGSRVEGAFLSAFELCQQIILNK
jgi:renalase